MKINILVIFAICMAGTVKAQNMSGFGMAYSSSNVFGFDVMIQDGESLLNSNGDWHVGFSHQYSGQHGSRRQAGTSNYGRSAQGGSNFNTTLDVGYSMLFNKVRLHIEGNVGQKTYYTNYSDRRFTTGGYYSVNGTEGVAGFGGDVSYLIFDDQFMDMDLFIGYGSLKEINFGMRILF